jgi:UDP-N-acetylmuramoyl-L-alanyl-D-glutamate--2,6-diaminopimelate ligase
VTRPAGIPPVRMDLLLREIDTVGTRGELSNVEVGSVEFDSRGVEPGALFCCLPGHHEDGHEHADEARRKGAVALLVERPLEVRLPQAVVPSGGARPAMARIAAAFFGHPARAMTTVGVTGTNGKTTVAQLLGAIFDASGRRSVVLGTLQGPRTTPEAPHLQAALARARDSGCTAAVLEVSSHALTQSRVDGIEFAAAVFTNLSHDHLDHHRTMEAYFEAKASLFEPGRSALGVVDADDEYGARLLHRASIPMVPYSRNEATDVEVSAEATFFTWRGHRVRLRSIGAHNVGNALAAATTAATLGVAQDAVVAGLEAAAAVPGRFEVVATRGPVVVVDYAHTPVGLRVALASARDLVGGRVICVFGCGGDRDREKRPAMGAVAAAGADLVVVTSDNPRHEDPRRIIDEVLDGIPAGTDLVVEPDRARAISLAVETATPADLVLVAGKGHESVIEVGESRLSFDDRKVAASAAGATWDRSARGGQP